MVSSRQTQHSPHDARHHPRTTGVSKYGLWRIPKVLLDLTTLKFLRDYFVTPIYFFGWVGILLVLGGLLAMGGSAWAAILGREAWAVGLMVLGPLLASLGVIEVTLGIIAEVLIRMNYELQHKEPYRIGSTQNLSPSPAED